MRANKYIMAVKGFGESSINFNENTLNSLNNGNSVITFDVEVLNLTRPTRNNVLYPEEEMRIALGRERITQLLRTGSFLGEREHPDDPENFNRWTKVDRANSHHKFTKLWIENGILMGTVQTIPGKDDLLNAIKG